MATVADMTLEELRQFVEETLEARLTRQLGAFEIAKAPDDDDLTWDEIRAAVDRVRWTPPEGAKISLELLREDRKR